LKTIFLCMDSLNRHYLSPYKPSFVKTPNIDRIFERAVRFENHYCGSLPCMPARREFFTGRLNFLEAPWGSLEPWDASLPRILRDSGIYTHMITDHYHYFEGGGAGYFQAFDSWELERGQEGDVWHPLVRSPEIPEYRGKNRRAYWVNRQFMDSENDLDYPTPRCLERAANFLDNNHGEDSWHIHLEVFDPHEPFVCPKKYLDMYGDDWQGYHFDWPDYAPVTEGEEAVKHIRRRYAGTLTMADFWLGKFLDKMDEYNLWEDTALIFTTDHGHLLGEHGYWAKNYTFVYEELSHIPLCICAPEKEHKSISALTAAIDLMPTILEMHGAAVPESVQGKSLLHLLQGDGAHHDAVLFGYFGQDINMFDGRHTYCRQPIPGSTVYMHTLSTDTRQGFLPKEDLERAELGYFLSYAGNIPQLRIAKKSQKHMNPEEFNPIYDILNDPDQQNPLHDAGLEEELAKKMFELLLRYEAPPCQFSRMGFDYTSPQMNTSE
jgi:arylsulfatase A-like enzyme